MRVTGEKIKDRLSFLLKSQEERENRKRNLTEENRQNILSLKDKFKDERCFIIGTSPSIKELDLTKLNSEYTFTVNRGYMLKEKGLNSSTFHVISDINTFKDENSCFEKLMGFSKELFCYAGMIPPVEFENVYYFDYIHYGLTEKNAEFDLNKPLTAYMSIIHFVIQIAVYLGFSEIYLLGVDLDFAQNKGHAYIETEGEKKRQVTNSVNNADIMLKGIDLINQNLPNNVRIFNASPEGIVDCIKRVKYEDCFISRF